MRPLNRLMLTALPILSILISNCSHIQGNRTVCLIKKEDDNLVGECKTGSEDRKSMPISLLEGFACMPRDDAKSYIQSCEDAKIDLKACQSK